MNEKLKARERLKAEIQAIEFKCMDKEKEIRKLQHDIEILERSKKKLYDELDHVNNMAIAEMPNGVKRLLNLIGIKTDSKLIKFAKGEYTFSEEHLLLINTAKYLDADDPCVRIACIYGIGKKTAQKMMELITKYNDDQF